MGERIVDQWQQSDKVWYLSGPMAGRQHHGYPDFENAVERLREHGYNVVSPHELHDVARRR